jgi:hypothetical protein
MKPALVMKNLWWFDEEQLKAKYMLVQYVSKYYKEADSCATPADAWKLLSDKFLLANAARMQEIDPRVCNLCMAPGEDIAAYMSCAKSHRYVRCGDCSKMAATLFASASA